MQKRKSFPDITSPSDENNPISIISAIDFESDIGSFLSEYYFGVYELRAANTSAMIIEIDHLGFALFLKKIFDINHGCGIVTICPSPARGKLSLSIASETIEIGKDERLILDDIAERSGFSLSISKSSVTVAFRAYKYQGMDIRAGMQRIIYNSLCFAFGKEQFG